MTELVGAHPTGPLNFPKPRAETAREPHGLFFPARSWRTVAAVEGTAPSWQPAVARQERAPLARAKDALGNKNEIRRIGISAQEFQSSAE
jgi:hypothetical protein